MDANRPDNEARSSAEIASLATGASDTLPASRPADRARTFEPNVGFIDVVLGPAFAGLAVGRLTTLALDDPSPHAQASISASS